MQQVASFSLASSGSIKPSARARMKYLHQISKTTMQTMWLCSLLNSEMNKLDVSVDYFDYRATDTVQLQFRLHNSITICALRHD